MNTDLAIDTPAMPAPHVRERVAFGSSGLPVLGLITLTFVGSIALTVIGLVRLEDSDGASGAALLVIGIVLLLAVVVLVAGLIMVSPGQARVLQFLGRYVGTVRDDGLRWVIPFTHRRRVS